MISLERLSMLAVDAVVDDDALKALCQEVRAEFGAHSHTLMTFGGTPTSAKVISTTFPDEALQAYEAYYKTKDDWALAAAQRPMPAIFVGHELVPDSHLVGSEIYNDFGKPFSLDVRHMACVIEPIAPGRIMAFGVHRSDQRDPFNNASKRRMGRLAPLIRATLNARATAAELRLRSELGFAALDAIERPIFLLNRVGQPLFFNKAASALLAEGVWKLVMPSLAERNHRLSFGRDDAQLRDALATVIDGQKPSEDIALGSGPARRFGQVLRMSAGPSGIASEGVAMLVVDSSAQPSVGLADRLSALFGLSRSEAQLSIALARGDTLKTYAESRSISIHTARWTLKQALSKTDTHRQAELVSLVLRLGSGRF